MTEHDIDQLILLAPEHLGVGIGELRAEILEAAKEALEATQDTEGGGKPSVTINHKIKINLARSPLEFTPTSTVSVTYKTEGETIQLDDPDQPELIDKASYQRGKGGKKQ